MVEKLKMLALRKASTTILSCATKTNYNLVVFLAIQVLAFAIALVSLNYMLVREETIAETRIVTTNRILKDNVEDFIRPLELYADDVLLKLTLKRNWWAMEQQDGHLYLKNLLNPVLPYIRHLLVYDEKGDLRLTSAEYPAPTVNVSDRDYFKVLISGAMTRTHYRPHTSRSTGITAYNLVRRMTYLDDSFGGVAIVGLDLAGIPDLCKNTIPTMGFESFIIKDGVILRHCTFPNKIHTDQTAKEFSEIYPELSAKLNNHTSGVYEDATILMAKSTTSTDSLIVVTLAIKDSAYSTLYGLIWQNYLLLMVGALAQLVCFMMYSSALRKAAYLANYDPTSIPLDSIIYAHLEWRSKLLLAAFDRYPLRKDSFADAKSCMLGKWLHGYKSMYGHLDSYKDCTVAHTEFHRVADEIVKLITEGDFPEAIEKLSDTSEFFMASDAIVRALTTLKDDISHFT